MFRHPDRLSEGGVGHSPCFDVDEWNEAQHSPRCFVVLLQHSRREQSREDEVQALLAGNRNPGVVDCPLIPYMEVRVENAHR